VTREGTDEKNSSMPVSTGSVLAASPTQGSGLDETMHLLMIIFRWLLGLLPGGVQTALVECAHVSVRAVRALDRLAFLAPDVPCIGRTTVRPVLVKFRGPPGRHTMGGSASCLGAVRQLVPVGSDSALRARILVPRGDTEPSKLTPPVWG